MFEALPLHSGVQKPGVRLLISISAVPFFQVVVSYGIGEVFFGHPDHVVTFPDSPLTAHQATKVIL